MLLILLFCFCLFPIIWEDLKSREISLSWFLLLSLATLLLAFLQPIPGFWKQISLNGCFILIQLAILSCYFSLRNKRWIWITNEGLGSGDIFFLGILIFFFPFINFLFFYFSSLIWTLSITGLFTLFSKRKIVKLPLAGLQALLLLILIILSLTFKIDIRSEDWLLNHLYLAWK